MSNGLSSMRTFKTVDEVEPTEKVKSKKSKKQFKNIRPFIKLPWILVVVLLIASLFLWQQYNQAKNKINTPSTVYNNQIESKLSSLIVLPNENPTVLTVKNSVSLKNIQFFSNSKNGDVLLIYPKAAEAILYRSTTDKIINISTDPTEVQSLYSIIFHG